MCVPSEHVNRVIRDVSELAVDDELLAFVNDHQSVYIGRNILGKIDGWWSGFFKFQFLLVLGKAEKKTAVDLDRHPRQ